MEKVNNCVVCGTATEEHNVEDVWTFVCEDCLERFGYKHCEECDTYQRTTATYPKYEMNLCMGCLQNYE